ncbi:hypothetical protein OPAG_09315, partial [Rhodococcus opacus PD630]
MLQHFEGEAPVSFKSPFPDVEIPNLSVYDFLFGQVDPADGDRPALIDGASGAVTTYQALIAQIDGVAGALAARGLAVGEVVGLHSPNVPAFASVFHGILRAGGWSRPPSTPCIPRRTSPSSSPTRRRSSCSPSPRCCRRPRM